MRLVRALAAVPALATVALLASPPSETDLRGALMWVAGSALEETDLPASRPPLRRVSLAGHDYGACSGVIATVLLDPEPCDVLWQRRPDPTQPIRK